MGIYIGHLEGFPSIEAGPGSPGPEERVEAEVCSPRRIDRVWNVLPMSESLMGGHGEDLDLPYLGILH